MKFDRNRSHLTLIAAIFFLSGAAGLIYEVVWERLLELYFGVTNVSILLIVSAYMAGLGLGSLAGGQISNRLEKPVFVYAVIELGIAIFGLTSPAMIIWIGSATAGASYPLVFAISFALLLIPTFLMGTTLPLLSQAFVRRADQAGAIVGLLYGINTLGAAIGALLAGFLFIGWVGLDGAAIIAFGLNITAGIAAFVLSGFFMNASGSEPGGRSKPSTAEQVSLPGKLPGYTTILIVSFVVGFLGLGYEVVWIRLLAIVNKNTVYGFPAILGIFLIGLALGGYYFGKRADTTRDVYRLFWKLETCLAVTAGATILIYYVALDWTPIQTGLQSIFREAQRPGPVYIYSGDAFVFSKRQFILGLFYFFLPVLWLVLPASFFMGGGLPVLDRMAIQRADLAGRWVGNVHVANILGSVAGTLVVGFVFLDVLGTERTLKILILASAGFILLAWWGGLSIGSGLQRTQALGLMAAILTSILLPGNEKFYMRYFQTGTGTQAPIIEEYADGVLALTDRFLWIRGDEHGSYPSDGNYEHNALACLGAARPKRVLIIGLGGGNTAYFISKIPDIEEIVIVELMEGLEEFLDENVILVKELLSDPRLKYITDDGRRYLYAHRDEQFDLIFIDPLRNYTAGHDSLYSVQAQQLYRDHLSPNGIFCEWHDENYIIPATTTQVFPFVDTFRSFTVAANAPIRYDVEYMDRVVRDYFVIAGPRLQPDAADHLQTNKVLLSFARDRSRILTEESETPILTDVNPWLEFYLFRPPLAREIRTSREAFAVFFSRLEGCDQDCAIAMEQRVEKLK